MKNNENEKIKEPKLFLALRIIGLSSIVIGVILVILGTVLKKPTGWGDTTTSYFELRASGLFILVLLGFGATAFGFMPKISKFQAKTDRYIQQETKSVRKDIATTNAEINEEGVKKAAKAIKEGLTEEIYCKHCGKKIESDSKFCKYCGKEQ